MEKIPKFVSTHKGRRPGMQLLGLTLLVRLRVWDPCVTLLVSGYSREFKMASSESKTFTKKKPGSKWRRRVNIAGLGSREKGNPIEILLVVF